ncbi:MAG: class I SAM-dependent methyltransferase [Nitrospira sp.]|nr:class I SAM-dependent methyltransferase [Nitrospira sp.]
MSNCPACGEGNIRDVAPFRYQSPIFANCVRAECDACGLVFASPMPNEIALSSYNADYFSSAHGGQPSDRAARAFFSAVARLRLEFVRRYLARHKIAVERVFEFGPGPGCFARRWLEDAPQSVYSAIETDRSCHESLTGLGVLLVDTPAEVTSDLVVMSHVLEHVSDPVNFVRTATQGLRSGGAIFIEVPCRDWEHKPLDEPHILFFDKKPMCRLLAHLGFRDVEVSYHGQLLSELNSRSALRTRLMQLRTKLISLGLVAPFARQRLGMESLKDPLERAVVAPFKAHEESTEPAWWLRAVARKA